MDDLQRLASQPHQLIRRDELLAAGYSAKVWRTATSTSRLIEVHPGVAVLPGRALDPVARIAAAVAGAGEGAMASHRTAAFLWGVGSSGLDPIDVVRSERVGRLRLDGVKVHRPADQDDLDFDTVQGISTTNPLRTLLDLGAEDRWAVDRALQGFVIKGLVTPESVDDALMRHSQRGRHGLVALRMALHALVLDRKPPDSVLEEEMARLVRRFGLPPMEFHARLGRFTVDFHIVGTPFYVECEGWTYHGLDKEQFEFDRERSAELLAAGYIGMRFTWAQIVRHPAVVARHVQAALATWKGRSG